jgi:hypothetical protein
MTPATPQHCTLPLASPTKDSLGVAPFDAVLPVAGTHTLVHARRPVPYSQHVCTSPPTEQAFRHAAAAIDGAAARAAAFAAGRKVREPAWGLQRSGKHVAHSCVLERERRSLHRAKQRHGGSRHGGSQYGAACVRGAAPRRLGATAPRGATASGYNTLPLEALGWGSGRGACHSR